MCLVISDGAMLEGHRGKMAVLIDYAELAFHDGLSLVLAAELAVGATDALFDL